MRQLVADKAAGSRLIGSISLCWGSRNPGEEVGVPARLHRGSDSQEDSNKTLKGQMLSVKCRGRSGCSSSEEGLA